MNNQTPLSPPSPAAGNNSEWSSPGRYHTSSPKSPRFPPYGRANLATPPHSGNFANGMNNPYDPGMNGMGGPPPGPPRPGDFRGNPSPPSSIGRSSNGTQMSGDAQGRKQSALEEGLGRHYIALKRYLGPSLGADGDGRPNRARDKLVRLSPTQFQELSTDVYDELLRRQAVQAGNIPPNVPPYLPPRDTFHPKRNQARQKLSTLPGARFRALSTDVFYELERRFPRFAGGPMMPPSRTGTPNGMRPGSGAGQMRRPPPRQASLGGQVLAGGSGGGMQDGPMQKSSQSNTIVPNKSYIVEDDDEGDLDSVYGGGGANRRDTTQTSKSTGANDKVISDYQNKVEELQERIGGLEKDLAGKDDALSKASSDRNQKDNESAEFNRIRLDLEEKVSDAQNLNENLQSEIDRLRSSHAEKERDLREQLDLLAQKGSDGGEWRARLEDAQRTNDELQRDIADQQRVTDEVRREAQSFLGEMKAISERSDASYQREEKLNQHVSRLEDELKEWKSRYASAKTQAGNTDGGAINISVQQPGVKEGLVAPDGLIKDVHITRFQLGIDDAIRAARSPDPTAIIDSMKSVVAAVKHISQEVPSTSSNDASSQKRLKMCKKVNATASNFITAVKNHAASGGISPPSLVDAAASHLSNAVVELVHLVRMRPTPAGELEVEDDVGVPYQEKSSKYFSSNGRSSVTESVYSNNTVQARASQKMSMLASQPYRVASTNGFPNGGGTQPGINIQEKDEDVEELRLYVDEQQATLVDTTQSLVSSIRAGQGAPNVLPLAAKIANLVSNIISRADTVLETNAALNTSAGPVVQNLAREKAKLLQAEDDCRDARSDDEWRANVNKMPPAAFAIARFVRELGAVLQGGLDEEDDFR